LVYEIGNGAIAPVIALTARDLGASTSIAALMLALLGIGQLLGDVPASWVADRLGDRHAMMVAAGIAFVALFGCLITPSLVLLGVALLAIGVGNAIFYLARQSYITEVVPIPLRARAISTLAGSHRIGLFIGPFAGALAISIGGLRSAFVVAMIAAASAALLLFLIPDALPTGGATPAVRGATGAGRMLVNYRRLFATLGVAVLAVGAVRATRQTVLPLWAEHIGLSATTTSLVFGIASAVDMALFYPSGKVMDQFGRVWIAVPCMLVLGSSMLLLPLTHGVVLFAAVAVLMSFGNGIGSGIIQTLGADVAPADSRTRFLSIWRVMSDLGNAGGPVVVSVVAAVSTLALGITAVGGIGLLGAGALAVWTPRYSPYATREMIRARAREQADG
jgi:MFS family permease